MQRRQSSLCRLATFLIRLTMTTLCRRLAIFVAALLASGAALATDIYPWRHHAAPFNFMFGNDIDTHQQTRTVTGGSLFGFFYVRFTGVVTKDRYGVATHVDCNAFADCTVGWILHGASTNASFLYQVPPDHPVFLVARPDIPQPGAYAHFHWLGSQPPAGTSAEGYLLQLTAADRFCFVHHDAGVATSNRTCRENGGVNVDPGIDIATHLNIVTTRPPGL
jgi:hypothetical protein